MPRNGSQQSTQAHPIPDLVADAAKELLALLKAKELSLVVAESCTAGLMGQVVSDAPGAAELFHGGFIAYTKDQKACALGVSGDLLRRHGAVCGEVAEAMAEGALRHSQAELSAAITGVAGPAPDPDGNPVGRVCLAVARRGAGSQSFRKEYGDIGREAVRRRAVADTLQALIDAARQAPAPGR